MITHSDLERIISEMRSKIGDVKVFAAKEKIFNLSQIIQHGWGARRCMFNVYYNSEYVFRHHDGAEEFLARYSYFARGIGGVEIGLLAFSFGEIKLIRFKRRVLEIWFNGELVAEVSCSLGLNCFGWGSGRVSLRNSKFFTFKTGLLHVTFPQYRNMCVQIKIKDFLVPLIVHPKIEITHQKKYILKGIMFEGDVTKLALSFEESIVIFAICAWLSGINTN